MIKKTSLLPYLSLTTAGCLSGQANGAVIFYGISSANDTNADPSGINIGSTSIGGFAINSTPSSPSSSYFSYNAAGFVFTSGIDITHDYHSIYGQYDTSAPDLGGNQNYANISFDGENNLEAVGQFYLDNSGGGYLVAIATLNDIPDPQNLSGVGGASLSISEGKALIDAASVPEPSSLALLALGSAGLLCRRKRSNKKA